MNSRSFARVRQVDEGGIRLWCLGDIPLDVLFDGQRVWSFWTGRDTDTRTYVGRRVDWPVPLRRFLDGSTRLVVREHVTSRVLFDQEMRFATGSERISVVNGVGAPLGIDKSGRMTATFEGRSDDAMRPLLQAIETVLSHLEDAGVEPFLAYGTLLGAVREGDFLGHDSDADLGYVSRADHPCDVILESFRLQRRLREVGLDTYRYSGAAFRVDVTEDDGTRRGLDVFGGFFDADRLHLMGEIGTEFEHDWIFPRSTVTMAGHEFPAPARPEELLRVTYGDGWRVPDPAFHFETPQHTVDQLTGWFRGGSAHRREWQRALSRHRGVLPRRGGSSLAREVHRATPPGSHVLDIGAGRGRDALWLAKRGRRVTAYDYVPGSLDAVVEEATRRRLDLEARALNLTELRAVLCEGARLAHTDEPRVIMARHVADATNAFGRDALARLASMSLRGGGRLYLDVWTGTGEPPARLVAVNLPELERRLRRHGATSVTTRLLEERDHETSTPRAGDQAGGSNGAGTTRIGRLVAEWN